VTTTLGAAALNMGAALILGAAIGFERQWRQRLAGLRRNTLVALGAETFVAFENLVPGDSSPTRVAAQVVPVAQPVSQVPADAEFNGLGVQPGTPVDRIAGSSLGHGPAPNWSEILGLVANASVSAGTNKKPEP